MEVDIHIYVYICIYNSTYICINNHIYVYVYIDIYRCKKWKTTPCIVCMTLRVYIPMSTSVKVFSLHG